MGVEAAQLVTHPSPCGHTAAGAVRAARRRAFSLLELVAVLLILALALAAVSPSLQNFAQGRRSHEAARSIIALANWARSQAISEGRDYRLVVDIEESTYYVTAREGNTFERVDAPLGRTFDLPDNLTVTWEEPIDSAGHSYVTFHPTGRLAPAVLRIEERTGRVTRIGAVAITDRFAVLTTTTSGATQ